ncbi:MAG: site-specific integrase [Bacteroidales bacterium]|nr:site-specific integrase [Bacteroidales bacterium]
MPTVAEFSEKWIDRAYPSVVCTTKIGLKIHMKKLTGKIGSKLITEVKPSDIKGVYAAYTGLSNSYIKAARQLYSAMFDSAVADGYLRFNPARDRTAKPHKGTEGGHRAITDQERKWIETLCTDHRAYPAVITMLYAGIRPQEAKALTIEKAVDPDSGVIHITQTAHRDGNNQYKITSQGKTKNAIRDVPLFPPVEKALSGKKGLLITTAHGEPITATTWYDTMESYRACMETAINGMHKRWYRRTKEHKKILAEAEALRKAGKKEEAEAKEGEIPPWIEFTVVPYDLRHSFCTWGRDHGVELHTMIEWMGHADAKMIMKIYDEVRDNRSKTEAEKLLKSAFRSGNGSMENSESQDSVEK